MAKRFPKRGRKYVTGVDTVIRNLKGIASDTPETLAAAMFQKEEEVMADSKENYVPVDQAVLQGSGIAHRPEIKGKTIEGFLTYGGPAKDYALEQHENLSYQHRQGGSKYLERPVLKHASTFARDVASKIQAMLRRNSA